MNGELARLDDEDSRAHTGGPIVFRMNQFVQHSPQTIWSPGSSEFGVHDDATEEDVAIVLPKVFVRCRAEDLQQEIWAAAIAHCRLIGRHHFECGCLP
ncbi:hypothetical protein D3C72_1770120 [compost metagenome]